MEDTFDDLQEVIQVFSKIEFLLKEIFGLEKVKHFRGSVGTPT